MATTQEILDKYRCPSCGDKLLAPAAENKDTKRWQKIKTQSGGRILLSGVPIWGTGQDRLKIVLKQHSAV